MVFNNAVVVFLYTVSLLAALSVRAAPPGPCDIYARGRTPCVAAHSTTRSLYASFKGALYQVTRASDKKTKDINPVAPGEVANAGTQDAFCKGTSCTISIIYDQSGRGNHLTRALTGAWKGPNGDGSDNLADANAAPVTLGGKKVYGVFIKPGMGYRNDRTNGVAVGNDAEGMYAVMDGSHYNNGCCFDYGNAEVSNTNTGNAHMEAVYFGTNTVWGSGAGKGPWVMADLENGLFSGFNPKVNTGSPTITSRFVTGLVKGDSSNKWALRSGNAQSGSLLTAYNGVRPKGYFPMKKEGAIVLGIGGDNSNMAAGTFYEGVMTSGYPSDATENAVQANIVAARYKA